MRLHDITYLIGLLLLVIAINLCHVIWCKLAMLAAMLFWIANENED